MRESELRRLNSMFAEKLGRAPNGQSLYKWCRTRDLDYLLHAGREEATVPAFTGPGECPHCGAAGAHEHKVVLVLPKYRRICWADRLGDVWVVSQWGPPQMTEQQWFYAFGSKFPYPANGRYNPITNSRMSAGMDPDQDVTEAAIWLIQKQLETPVNITARECADAAKESFIERQKQWNDAVDDLWPEHDLKPHVFSPGVPKTAERTAN